MKKFLSVISLMLVALMVIAIPAVSAEEYTMDIPEGVEVYYATDVSDSAPSIDGQISEGEYGTKYTVETPKAVTNASYGVEWENGTYDETLASEYIDFYFAYDDENIYFAFYEMGAAPVNTEDDATNTWNNVPFRNNYRFNFGFELENVTNYLQTEGASTNDLWNKPAFFSSGSKISQTDVLTQDMVVESVVAKYDVGTGAAVAFGGLDSTEGNLNYKEGQWALVVEYRFEKAKVAEVWNTLYNTEYNTISNAMWVGMTTNAFRCTNPDWNGPFDSQYFRWLGMTDITGQNGEYEDYGLSASSTRDYMFDLVVFAEEGDDIVVADPFPPETTQEPATTEPATTEPATTEPTETESTETESAETEPAETESTETEPAETEPTETETETSGGLVSGGTSTDDSNFSELHRPPRSKDD